MFRIEKISSLDLPELAPYRTMRRSVEHEAQGIFIAEGEKVTRRLLESRFTVVSVVLPEKWLEKYRPLLEVRPEEFIVYLAEKSLLETLVGYSLFQGVLSVGKIPPPASLDDILARSSKPQLTGCRMQKISARWYAIAPLFTCKRWWSAKRAAVLICAVPFAIRWAQFFNCRSGR
jgi:hypothetical protein